MHGYDGENPVAVPAEIRKGWSHESGELSHDGVREDVAWRDGFSGRAATGDVVQRTTNKNKTMDLPSSIFRVRVEGEEAPRVLFESNIREKFWKQRCIALHVAGDGALEIIHPLADRGIAVQDVARRLGTPRETVMAVVSSERSAGLAEWSGFTVALSDAPATIQDLADVTTEAASEDGLAEALHTWILAPDPQTTETA